ncbi:VMAP-C domain-containing protein [Streptomyces sp. NPDC005146]
MRGFNPLLALQELLERCRVFVQGATDGTGFFVAPRFIVSCAHVTGSEPDETVLVRWGGSDYQAVIRAATEDSRTGDSLYPFPDLAILELVSPPPDHPCVWLDPAPLDPGTKLTAVGFTNTLDSTASERRAILTAKGGLTSHNNHDLLEMVDGEVNSGLSGGPVLSHVTGGVCAVVKATRLEDSTMGGFGVPVDALRLLDPEVYRTVIRAHDRFHIENPKWHTLSDQVEEVHRSGASTDRAADRTFLDLLAALPDGPPDHSGMHTAAFLAAAAQGTQPGELPLLTHRNVYTDLATQMMPPPKGELPYELAFCADLARGLSKSAVDAPDALRDLRDQVLIRAGELGLGSTMQDRLLDNTTPALRTSVIGRIRHSLRDRSLYHVMVWRYRSQDDIVPGGPESPALPLQEALAHLEKLLPQQIDLLGGMAQPGLIELILPHEALDVNFADWQLWPDWGTWLSLGRKHHLVVRPLERHEAPNLHHAWTQRWQHLQSKPVGEALFCVCGRNRQRQEALDATFNSDPTLAAVALAGSPRSTPVSDAYRVAITSGVPLMVWQREAEPRTLESGSECGIPGRDVCPDGMFLAQTRAALASTERDAVPERICALRNAAQLDESCEEHAGERVVILWDDPRRQIPRTSLAPAAPAEEGRTE